MSIVGEATGVLGLVSKAWGWLRDRLGPARVQAQRLIQAFEAYGIARQQIPRLLPASVTLTSVAFSSPDKLKGHLTPLVLHWAAEHLAIHRSWLEGVGAHAPQQSPGRLPPSALSACRQSVHTRSSSVTRLPVASLPASGSRLPPPQVSVVGRSLEGGTVPLDRAALALSAPSAAEHDGLANDEPVSRRLSEIAAALGIVAAVGRLSARSRRSNDTGGISAGMLGRSGPAAARSGPPLG